MPRLSNPWFEARFIRDASADGGMRIHHEDGSPISFAETQGLLLWCPCGYGKLDKEGHELYPLDLSENKGRPHGLLIPFSNGPGGAVPDGFGPYSRDGKTRPRWTVSGDSLDNLTLTPSVAVGKIECWHGFITNGEVA